MEIVVAVWLIVGAFILGANTGNPEIASASVENLIATSGEHRLTEADPHLLSGESVQEHACSMGRHDVIYRDLARPHVSPSE